MNLDGSGKTPITRLGGYAGQPAIDPAGRRVVFTYRATANAAPHLYETGVAGGPVARLTWGGRSRLLPGRADDRIHGLAEQRRPRLPARVRFLRLGWDWRLSVIAPHTGPSEVIVSNSPEAGNYGQPDWVPGPPAPADVPR